MDGEDIDIMDQNQYSHPIANYLDFGQKVNARWQDGKYYSATICQLKFDENVAQVVFDDGLTSVIFFF